MPLNQFQTEKPALEFLEPYGHEVKNFVKEAFVKEGQDYNKLNTGIVVLHDLYKTAHLYIDREENNQGYHVCNFSLDGNKESFRYGSFPYEK